MDFLPQHIAGYVAAHTSPEPPLLQRVSRDTHAQVLMPRMLSGHVQGRVLAMLSQMIRPRRVLEIGTYTGYSALCLAEGLAPDGLLYTVDVNEELEDRVRGYVQAAGLSGRIIARFGDALEVVPALDETWDLVFLDADKRNYPRYYDLVLPRLRPGGFLIADNVLWSGKVTQPPAPNDKDLHALLAFNTRVQHDERVENALFPIRDGLMVVRKR